MRRAGKIALERKRKPNSATSSAKKEDDEPHARAEGPFTLSDALLIAVCTGLAYFFSYLYECGFLGTHGISTDLVEVSLGTVLLVLGTIGLFLGIPFVFYLLIRSSITPTVSLILRAGMMPIAITLGAIFALAAVGWTLAVIALWVSAGLVFLIMYVKPLVHGEGTYLERLKSDIKAERASTLKMLEPYLKFFGLRYWTLLLVILTLMTISLWLGGQIAKGQQQYPTFNYQGRAWAIVRAYGDRWIVREVNYSTGSFEKAYAVMQAQPVVLNETKVSK